ncbi:sugar ABC transporter ATP-binding protein [Cutibacterium acnes]|jgi:ribose ABC transporter, ATP-binding protein RbsA|nr:ABC transporter, ATP-binding protein [Cutibacterium acnes SK137]AYW81282.1 sugar ABC transporter ATP-binding protein [Cutibacterium acnes]EFS37159.1 ABC transporter, ATP-binding protein [Cutibacterium acnes HL074PA1]EFS49497.1 ABC transporter, ATP-binding protein [Cutibacterium acnes HL083PA1]EFS70031.1 ABC transporter, ATP-binding protein [Cutibacterium acnes HL007PA1]EFS70491.1 ABC transporter, ATP-binding protein [Cutibacterium acnes HL056PA1]EFT19306.1 ABC transporter, ATP-binding prot
MMSGIYHPDSGSVVIDDTPVELPTVKAAEARGIATIHQELNLVPQMSVAENIMLGRTPSRGGLVNWGLMRAQARAALERIGLDVSPDRLVGSLSTAHQQLVEIARALSMDARVLILDEPTAALTRKESGQLFEVMDDLKTKGVAMVFISHHLDEIPRVGDDVSVLRDGTLVGEVPARTSERELVTMMVGRDIDDQFPRHRGEVGEVLLSVTGLSRERAFQDVGFDLHAGEVLGLAGLVGAGRTEVLRAIAGADKYDSGTVRVRGKELPKGKISRAIVDGIGHVPEERKSQGLVLDASVNENLGYATMKSTSHAGLVDRSGQRRRAQNVAEKLRVRMASLDQPVRNLSGGNQQKVVIGRWILADLSILLLDEPTRGVDVGAKVEIYQLINAVTDAGGAVLMVSSELPEVIGMSDRILVMSHGRAMGILDAKTATEDAVMELAVASVDPVDEKTG